MLERPSTTQTHGIGDTVRPIAPGCVGEPKFKQVRDRILELLVALGVFLNAQSSSRVIGSAP